MEKLLAWDIYQISSHEQSLTGIKLRGTLRKYAIEQALNLLAENASDEENCVRFALLTGTDPANLLAFIASVVPTTTANKMLDAIPNPVLSKLKVNDISRYN